MAIFTHAGVSGAGMSYEVTLEDREVAFRISRCFLGNDDPLPEQLLDGRLERHWLLDLVARHRLQAFDRGRRRR